MSVLLFPQDILFFQRLLKIEGLYKHALDGTWGRFTEAAANQFEVLSEDIKERTREFDFRTEKNIRTLKLEAQREARIFMDKVLSSGIKAKIISGTRTYDEQNILFKKGRFGNPGPRVTNARGGQSNHNFCVAWDIGIFTKTGGYITDGKDYEKAANVGMLDTLEWGGNWHSFQDKPHFQLKTNLKLAEVRAKFEVGENFTMAA